MSTTYINAIAVAAVRDEAGRVWYAGYEQTHESNVFPQTPHWGVMAFGTAQDIMARGIRIAASLPGGMVRWAGQNVSPTAMIKRWREKLACPVKLVCCHERIEFGSGLYKLNPDKMDVVAQVLAQYGRDHDGKGFDIQLPGDAQMLVDLMKTTELPAWKFLLNTDMRMVEHPDLGYIPETPGAIDLPELKWVTIDHRSFGKAYLCIEGEKVTFKGWDYNVVGYDAGRLAEEAERQMPGTAEAIFRHVKKTMGMAVPLGMNDPIELNLKAGKKWHQDAGTHIRKGLGLADDSEWITTSLAEIKSADLDYYLNNLDPEEGYRLPGPGIRGDFTFQRGIGGGNG